ncbi:MAG: hypothetical protein K2N72_12575, partial [Oscillospiraceae bacterium]|nr:hypothetical protein [Oscillospiraceae bacterium]
MKKKALAMALLLSLMSCGCGSEEEAEDETNEEYIAVYEEITMTQSIEPTEEAHVNLPAAYNYDYSEHLLIVGDEICGGFVTHGLMEEGSIIRVACAEPAGLLGRRINIGED